MATAPDSGRFAVAILMSDQMHYSGLIDGDRANGEVQPETAARDKQAGRRAVRKSQRRSLRAVTARRLSQRCRLGAGPVPSRLRSVSARAVSHARLVA